MILILSQEKVTTIKHFKLVDISWHEEFDPEIHEDTLSKLHLLLQSVSFLNIAYSKYFTSGFKMKRNEFKILHFLLLTFFSGAWRSSSRIKTLSN